MLGSKSKAMIVILIAGLVFSFMRNHMANGEVSSSDSYTPLSVDTIMQMRDSSFQEKPSEPEYVQGEIIVKFKSNINIEGKVFSSLGGVALTGDPSIDRLNRKHNVSYMEKIIKTAKKPAQIKTFRSLKGKIMEVPDLSNIYLLKCSEDKDILSVIEEYKTNRNVEYAEPNHIYHTCETIPNEYADRDALAEAQWGLDKIDAPDGWDIETGSADVVIAVLDTGVDLDHPDLANNIWVNTGELAFNGIDDDGNGYIDDVNGWDCINDDNDPMDDNGHGTHCSGIASAVTNNSIGVAGVSWKSKIMALKFLDSDGYGSEVNAIEAINYAADNGAKILSNSWCGSSSQSVEDAINSAYSKGCVVIVAAGNRNSRQNSFSPAAYENVVTVAATQKDDHKASFSNYGDCVDVSAPGVDIYSTLWDNTYGFKNGTSMACSFVSGLSALLLSQNPDCSNSRVIEQIMGSVDNINPLNLDPRYGGLLGTGRINVYQALTFTPQTRIFVSNCNSEPIPGETIDMVVTLHNIWEDATGVTASLSTNDPYVTIVSNSFNFGDIPSQSKANNSGNPYSYFLNEDCPLGYLINWTLSITADGGYTAIESVTIPVLVPPQEGWPVLTGDLVCSSPALGDIDGDGDIEIVVSASGYTGEDMLYVFHHDGTNVSGWPVYLGGYMISSPALGDIDGDGDIEVVVGSFDSKVYAFHHDGTNVSGWPVYVGSHVTSSPALGDIDRDGDMEIVVGSCDHNIYAFHHDGTNVSGWPVDIGGGVESSPALGDIDRDGDMEIVVGSDDHNIYALHHDGTNVSGWPVSCSGRIESSPALGDIDGDGDIEVVVGSYDHKVYALHHDGTSVSGWPVSCSGRIESSPALGDIDGDGDIEIVIGSEDYKVYALHHDGTNVSGWPVATGGVVGSSPALGDIDGDGDIEIVIGSRDHNVHALHHDGTNVSGWPVATGGPVSSSPALGDIDGDGDIEVVIGSVDGKVYAWDCPGAYNPLNIEWGTFHHNVRRTGLHSSPMESSLVASWGMDEGTGLVIYDETANDNDGTIYGATWTSGKLSSALSFDGVDDYVWVNDDVSIDITDTLTIEAWIKIDELNSVGNCIVSKPGAYWFYVHDSGKLVLEQAGGSYESVWSNGVLSTNVWYHVAGVWDTAGGKKQLYINGELDAEGSPTNSFAESDYKMTIGGYGDGWGMHLFKGSIDEVKIYDYALSEGEILEEYEKYQKIRIIICDHSSEPTPGETTDMVVTLHSIWEDATAVTALLSTDDSYVTIVSNSANFGDMPSQSKASNSGDPFSYFVRADCPLDI